MKSNFIFALITGLAVFMVFRITYLRHSSFIARFTLILIASILAVPAILFASNYILCLPYAPWFVEFHALPGAEISAGLIGAMLGIMFASAKLRPDPLNRSILIVSTVFALILLITPFYKQLFYSAEYFGKMENKWKGDVCLQTTGYTCVPACCAMVIRTMGGNVTEPELARAAGTNIHGTESWYLIRALRRMGYEPRIVIEKTISKAPVPSIIGVSMGSVAHVVTLLKKDSRSLDIGEPMSGKKHYTWSKFERVYKPDGFCIVISKKKQ